MYLVNCTTVGFRIVFIVMDIVLCSSKIKGFMFGYFRFMGIIRPETHIYTRKYVELTRNIRNRSEKCEIYPNMDPNYLEPTRHNKDPKMFRVLTGTRQVDPNRPGPDRTRPGTDPNFFKNLYGSKILGPKRPGPDKTRPEPDPRTRMPRPTLSVS